MARRNTAILNESGRQSGDRCIWRRSNRLTAARLRRKKLYSGAGGCMKSVAVRPNEPSSLMSSEPEILLDRRGTAAIVTLNRPAALNAVTRGMLRTLHEALERWRHDGAVSRIIVTAAGGRAFSAGGDLRQIYEAGRACRQEEPIAFWREEYALNAAIKRYPKPYVALIDGIVMGGGVGVSVHGSHRVAGDRFQFAMPEVGIGFFPDVGATWVLPRLPWRGGYWLGLTGARIGRGSAAALGLATHSVAAARFEAVIEALAAGDALELVEAGLVARSFGAESIEEILAALDQAAASGSAFAADAAAA